MFRPKSMKKVRLIVLKSHVGDLVKDLHEAGLVDIRKTRHEGLDEGRPLGTFDELSAELVKLRGVLSLMEAALPKKDAHVPVAMDGKDALEEARNLGFDAKLRALNQEANALAEKVKTLEGEALNVEKVLPFKGVDFSKLTTRTLSYRVGEMQQGKIDHLEATLTRMSGQNALVSEEGDPATLVIYERKDQQAVDVVLADFGFSDIDLPQGMKTPMEAINTLNAENDKAKSRLSEVRAEMGRISKGHIKKVKDIIFSLEIEADRAEIASRFASSKCAYVLEGWVLESEAPAVKAIADKYDDVIMEDVHFGHGEMPPTVLDNPKQAGPMEFITKSYSLPNYFEIDPTMMYLVALPILYGMIVGDFIYGLMSIVLGFILLRKFEKSYIMSNVSKIWMISGVPSMAFGIFYDEWGGMSHYHVIELINKWTGVALAHAPLYTGFSRMENVLALIALSALAGLIHLGAGFILGAINEWNHSKRHAFAKIAWLGVEIGLTLALLPYLPSMLPQLGYIDTAISTAGLVLLGISAVILTVTEGVLGIIEIPGLVGNILSYSRIAAIGIVGVVIAELLNEFILPMPEQGVFAIVLLPVFFVLHVMNCFVAMFESLVQGGRLNIVEFRSKFMHGGGDVFIPFALYSKKL